MKIETNIIVGIDKTKNGNVFCNLLGRGFELNGLEAVLKEKGQNIKFLINKPQKGIVAIIPQRGMLLQLDGELYRLMRINRNYIGEEDFEEKDIREKQKRGEFEYSILLTPSRRFTDGLEVVWSLPEATICNKMEDAKWLC